MEQFVINGLCGSARRDSELVAKDLAQAGVDVEGLGDVALRGQGAHEHLITALPERGPNDELAAGPHCCWQFRTAAELRELFSPAGRPGGGELITYCTIGGRACTAGFALTYLLGLKHVAVYDGSWAAWGRCRPHPSSAPSPDGGIQPSWRPETTSFLRAASQVQVQPPSTTSVCPVT
jgi:hypothetical protein